ncbi:ABC transporter permease [Bacillus sp. EB600]|uniref:ABC transporter permease n=1 Tax=Bacillus sp. EB600 TaxID=2806345 RepID=UPI002109CF42|nr:ABC transporter permease [Bacillus sp. EB600]MCQ6280663.1 ABC transporter permease [Bacillus sp. EB600]
MFDDNKLWRERFGQRTKDLGKYLRYIFNGHLMVVLLFLLGSAAYYYQNWVKGLPDHFPSEIIMAICIGLFLTYSPVYNFLLEADQVFLLPLENKMKRYFYRSGIISFIFQGYILLLVLAVFMPMFARVSSSGFRPFFPFLIVLLVSKAWNLASGWRIQYFIQPSIYRWDAIVRYFINTSFAFLLFKQANPLILVAIALVMVLYFRSFYIRTKNSNLKWDLLINQEEKRMNSFYRLANLFTDVPTLKDTVKRRKWLDFLLQSIPFSQEKTYHYLYTRTFLRSGDYLGLFVRLTVIGGIAIYFLSFGLGQVLLAVLFLYLTGFQLLPLWNHHQNKLWVDLYPVHANDKKSAFYSLLMVILIVQTIIFAIILLIKSQWSSALLELLVGGSFSYYFVFIYSKKRFKAE